MNRDLIPYRCHKAILKFLWGSNFVEGLSAQFPHERNNIETYVQRIREVALESPLYNIQEIHEQVFLNPHSVKLGVQEFMYGISPNTVLQNVLLGNIPLYAGQRDKTPLYIHALIHNFYIQSAYRLVGGSDSISNSLAASIQVHGMKFTQNLRLHIFIAMLKSSFGRIIEWRNNSCREFYIEYAPRSYFGKAQHATYSQGIPRASIES